MYIRLAQIGSNIVTNNDQVQYYHYQCVNDFLADALDTDIIIIQSNNDIIENACSIRKIPKFRYTLLLSESICDLPCAKQLIDGHWSSLNDAIKSLNIKVNRIAQLPNREQKGSIYSFASYLYVNNGMNIAPERNLSHPTLFTYPILDCFFENQSQNKVIDELSKLKVIQPLELVERLRLCPNCDDAHLNYVDQCPQCHSIDISTEVSIHCFICGHVDNQDHFVNRCGLKCPNCLHKLKHIGTDYDRPIENLRCAQCSNYFVDGEVVAKCMVCDRKHTPENLELRSIYSLSAGSNIEKILFSEDLTEQTAQLGEVVGFKHFTWQLDWALKLASRGLFFASLVKLQFDRHNDDLQKFDKNKELRFKEAFINRLAKQFRVTDIITQKDELTYYILLPCTTDELLKIVLERIHTFVDSIVDEESKYLDIKVSVLSLDKELSIKNKVCEIFEKLI
ncbi:TackOD1 domain-containing metal-binding protein [Spartinivicinus ruber]|uniref:TackOD1 domain-containing metal-binding protein n=1 Tax=Spartinivicinus ruber TaxID=2683272 RepID=UPI0013D1D1AE|nr:hypothetical protein [Spartinivicinus ruber]